MTDVVDEMKEPSPVKPKSQKRIRTNNHGATEKEPTSKSRSKSTKKNTKSSKLADKPTVTAKGTFPGLSRFAIRTSTSGSSVPMAGVTDSVGSAQ